MFILKKRNIVIAVVSILIIVTFVLCIKTLNTLPIISEDNNKLTVVLDAGHGGIDGGVSGIKTNVKESELNLSVVKKLQVVLESAGFNVILTRTSEAGLYGIATSNLKKKDMAKRKEIIEDVKPDIVLSIHMNYYSVSSRRGAQVFYKKGDENGKNLAECIQKSFNSMEESSRTCNVLTGDYFMLNCSKFPSVICECGFLSNPDDEALLIKKEYQESLAYSIFKGVIDYLSKASFKFF